MTTIHPQALVDSKAELAEDVQVGPFAIIGPEVKIGAGTVVGPHAILKGPTTIGMRNRIFQFASVGEDCQDKKYKGESTELVIGDDNIIREGVTLHRGTFQDRGITHIGSNNLFMCYVHVAHDCVVGDNIIMANNTAIAGHVHIGNGAILGGGTLVHQFCRIGQFAMTAAGTVVLQDIPAFVTCSGNRAEAHGMNIEGMRRRGVDSDVINRLREAYKTVYRRGLTLDQAITELDQNNAGCAEVDAFLDSLKSSQRGIVR
ncbi:MAG: acyl-ACP--UDP-N-acetylglucosamine O-acyltransferase [Pseudomonadota bacterium]|nr:acyl-ACP--UDP-N-acetylglucosamine O-acyltransferase [Pseudomonadota bacterium]